VPDAVAQGSGGLFSRHSGQRFITIYLFEVVEVEEPISVWRVINTARLRVKRYTSYRESDTQPLRRYRSIVTSLISTAAAWNPPVLCGGRQIARTRIVATRVTPRLLGTPWSVVDAFRAESSVLSWWPQCRIDRGVENATTIGRRFAGRARVHGGAVQRPRRPPAGTITDARSHGISHLWWAGHSSMGYPGHVPAPALRQLRPECGAAVPAAIFYQTMTAS